MSLLIKLFLAHLLGDFVFQSSSWVKNKEQKKLKAWQFYVHILIHGILIMLLTWDKTFLLPCMVIILTHGIIDAVKLFAQTNLTKRMWFMVDQALHIFILLIVWYFTVKPTFNFNEISNTRNLLLITCYVSITLPASVVIKFLISKWTPNLDPLNLTGQSNTDSLQDAGKFIGILERLMVFTFIIIDHWEAVGFLIAAKSIFRFGDLKESHELKLTEYVLIGTLLSFGIAIGVGLIFTGCNLQTTAQ